MADPAMSVTPYWELTFDADGDPDTGRRDRLLAEVVDRGVKDLVVFSHGWNSDRSGATRLYSRFFAPFPQLALEPGSPPGPVVGTPPSVYQGHRRQALVHGMARHRVHDARLRSMTESLPSATKTASSRRWAINRSSS